MFDTYLNVVRSCIKNKRLHAPICAELESHLADKKDFYTEIGYDERTAELKALKEMGNPLTVGESMAKLHKLSRGQVFVTILLMLFGIIFIIHSLILVMTTVVYPLKYGIDDEIIFQNPAFFFVEDFIILIIFTAISSLISLRYRRTLTTYISIAVLCINVFSVWHFSKLLAALLTGRPFDMFSDFSLNSPETEYPYFFYIISALLFIGIIFGFIRIFIRVIYNINVPFDNNIKTKRLIRITSSCAVIVSVLLTSAAYITIYKEEKAAQKTHYQSNELLYEIITSEPAYTAKDFDTLLNRFSEFDFNITSNSQNFSATGIENSTEICISGDSSGSIKLTVKKSDNYCMNNLLSLYPDLYHRIVKNRDFLMLNSFDESVEYDNFIQSVKRGDNLKQIFETQKKYNVIDICYEYNPNTYSSTFTVHTNYPFVIFGMDTFEITAVEDIITDTFYILD